VPRRINPSRSGSASAPVIIACLVAGSAAAQTAGDVRGTAVCVSCELAGGVGCAEASCGDANPEPALDGVRTPADRLSTRRQTSQSQRPETPQEETLSGPDSHEIGQGAHGHLLGDWGGARSRLFERGVRFDLHYVSDSLANVESVQSHKFFGWNRIRGWISISAN
jgi:hypothetical protein